MQSALTAWEGGIRATGGSIVTEKSHWYEIDFVWANGNWKFASVNKTPASISVKDSDGQTKVLQRLSSNEARRTLGVRLAPDGNNESEFEELKDKACLWADAVRSGHLPRRLVWESLNTTVLRSIQYSLPSTTLSFDQCRTIMSKLLSAALPCSGIVRTIPRALVYGPLKYQGLSVPCLFTHQQVEHILRILKFCRAQDHLTARLLRQSVEATRLEIGCSGSLFSLSFADFGTLATSTWVTHTWEFLANNGMSIRDDGEEFSLQCIGDQLVTEAFFRAGVTGYHLKRANVCRLFLKVVTVSEILTGCGDFITKAAWNGSVDETRRSSYDWPNQGCPSISDWDLWRKALMMAFCNSQRKMRFPLGRWTSTDQHGWFFDPSSDRLYCRNEASVTMFPRSAGRATTRYSVCRFNALAGQEEEAVLVNACPATIERHRAQIILTRFKEVVDLGSGSIPSLEDYVANTLHVDARWAVNYFQATDGGKRLQRRLLTVPAKP